MTEAVRIVARVTRQVQVSAGGVYHLGYYVVWCPKCAKLIRAKAAGRGWWIVALEIMPDHVHLLVKGHRSGSPSQVASQVTGLAWRYLRAGLPHMRSGLPTVWPGSYVAATVGAVPAATVRRYISTRAGRRWRMERPR